MKNTRKKIKTSSSVGVVRKKQDFALLKKQGKTLKNGGCFIRYRENEISISRVALFFPRWTGNAVRRSRFRRWARHFIREQKWSGHWDCMMGFEKKGEAFYEEISYSKFYSNFKDIYSELK